MDKKAVSQALDAFRRDIDTIDEEIVSLLARRKAVVEEVVAFKKNHDLPVYHPAREEDLISRKRDQGVKAGLDPDYLEALFRTIIRRSRVEQAGTMAKKGVFPGAVILIAGGRGGMGAYFHHWFLEAGYQVRILDKDDWPNVRELCSGIDLAFVCVPIETTSTVIEQLSPHLPGKAVLSDITSVKAGPVEAMMKHHSGPVIGLHPLFGPSTSTLDKQIVVAVSGRDSAACQWVTDQFAAWGSVIVRSGAREHDEIMDIVQSLRHFATFTFGQFLQRRNINLQRTLEFSSPIYRLELGMVGRLFAQDPSLYSEIIFASRERRELLKSYIRSLESNLDMLEQGDKARFSEEFQNIAGWFGSFSEQAMRESTFLIDKLIERF